MMQTKAKTLIVYGSRYGATAGTAEEIAKTLREDGFDVRVANLKEEKIKNISEYELIVVGSGMALGNWVNEAEDFVKNFQKNFDNKKLAIFISSLKPVEEKAGKTAAVTRTRKIGLDEKILKYHLKPIMVGFFGGVLDYNKMSFLTRKAMEVGYKSQLQKYGFNEGEPGIYDLHNWDEIRSWTRELAQKVKE
ncbi:MAG TPA: flavodoxin domain-containing protein [Candidatus Acidoferrum sp.]|nr:flavodoxin domain-containing protein [Candidatus Acidoferrum sp.]